jgi:signal peptidase I
MTAAPSRELAPPMPEDGAVPTPDEPIEPSAAPDPDAASEPAPARSGELRRWIGTALGAALLLLVVAIAALVIVVPKLTGAVPLTVLTNSMSPGLPPGTLLIVEPVDFDDIAVGDVITYQVRSGDPTVITHRVIGETVGGEGDRRLILQGDNNAEADPDPVREAQVQARLWYSVPLLGWVNSAVGGEERTWIVSLIAGALFAYAAWMLVSALLDRRRKRRDAVTGAAAAEPGAPAEPHGDDRG